MDSSIARDHTGAMGKRVASAKRARRSSTSATTRKMHITTIRIWRDQWDALQRRALDHRAESGESGRMDASAILREVLDRAGIKA